MLYRYDIVTGKTLHAGHLGEASLKKNGKIWEKFPIRLGPNLEMFEVENISTAADPLG